MRDDYPDELFAVLDSLKPALKSFDVRTLAVKLDDSWQNLITSIYLTEKSVDEVQKEHSKLTKLRNNQVVLLSKTSQFDYEIFGEIQRGLVPFPTEFGRNKVHFRNFDPFTLKVRSTKERFDETLKYVFIASDLGEADKREKLWRIIDDQKGEAKRHGCPDMYDLIHRRLKISYNDREPKDIEIRIPSLAKIDGLVFENSNVNVEMKMVAGLPNLQLNMKQERVGEGGFQDEIWSDYRPIKEVTDF